MALPVSSFIFVLLTTTTWPKYSTTLLSSTHNTVSSKYLKSDNNSLNDFKQENVVVHLGVTNITRTYYLVSLFCVHYNRLVKYYVVQV